MAFYKLFYNILIIISLAQNVFSSASCELIDFKTKCTVSNGNLVLEKSYLIQINNRNGDRYTNIYIPFTKGDNVKINEAQIESLTGNVIRKLSKKQIKERSAISDFSLYEDDFVKYFSLQHTQYPYRIRYSYKVTYNKFIHIADWTPVIDTDIPTHSASLTVNVPAGYPVKVYEKNIDKSKSTHNAGYIGYTWNASYKEQIVKERFSPSLRDCLPQVSVIPKEFNYGIEGSTDSWQTFGNWLYRLTEGLNELPESDKQLVDQIKSKHSDTLEVIEKLYKHLQKDTRYIFVKIDIGGLKPYPAEYVSNNGYGDCKALANYMKSMLDYAGIKSYYTIVNAGTTPGAINAELPSQQFNHVILSVPYKRDTIWLECTSDITPFNYLGTFTQNRKALIIDNENSKLVNTPALTNEDVHSLCKYNFDIDFLGNVRLKSDYSLNGPDFEIFEDLRQQYTDSEKDKIIRHIFPLPSLRLSSWDIKGNSNNAANVNLSSEMEIVGYTKNYGDNIIFDVLPSRIPTFETPDERTLPVLVNYPINQTDSLVYNLPADFTIEAMPDNFIAESTYGDYSAQYFVDGNKLFLVREFQLYTGNYELDEYVDFYNFMKKIYVFENNKTVMLTKK